MLSPITSGLWKSTLHQERERVQVELGFMYVYREYVITSPLSVCFISGLVVGSFKLVTLPGTGEYTWVQR